MMWLNNLAWSIGESVVHAVNVLDKHRPAIFIGAGVVGMGATVVVAVKRAKKLDEIYDDYAEKISKARDIDDCIKEYGEEATAEAFHEEYGIEKEYFEDFNLQREEMGIWMEAAGKCIKTMAPVGALFAVSTGSILYGYSVLNGRYLGVIAAFNGLSQAFGDYRDRVQKEQGLDWDTFYMTGKNKPKPKKKKTDEDDETLDDDYWKDDEDEDNPNEDYETAEELCKDPRLPSIYAKFFGPESACWTGNPNVDLMFLRGKEDMFNDRLLAKEKVFLNEVYDGCGFEMTPAGAPTGWIKGQGSGKIDFGLDKIETDPSRIIWTKSGKAVLVLDFNVQGVIWDKI